MKKQLLLGLAAVAVLSVFPACTTVVEDETPTTHSTTTTESTSVHRPSTAVESTTVRSY